MSLSEKLQDGIKGKKHVIWDWNGTLLSDVQHAVDTVNFLLIDHALPVIDSNQYRKLFEFPVINYYSTLGFDFQKESFESLCHRFVERFMAGVNQLPLYSETKSVLISLHGLGIHQSVLSATDQANLNAMIKHFQLSAYFRFVYGIDNKLAGSKIQRGRELITQSGFDLSDTVIIGDTLHDLEVANALGVDAVLISHGHQCGTRLKPHHSKVIDV